MKLYILLKVTLLIIISFSFVYSQNLIKNPCFTLLNKKEFEYKILYSKEDLRIFKTCNCVYFYKDINGLVIDTTKYMVLDWKEFSTTNNYSYNITNYYESDWFLCVDSILKSCSILFYPHNVWFSDNTYIAGKFEVPLKSGYLYKFSFKIKKNDDNPFSIRAISVLFSREKDSIENVFYNKCIPTRCDLTFSLSSDTNWQYCESYFRAKGNEKFFCIGIMDKRFEKINALNKNNYAFFFFKYLHKKQTRKRDFENFKHKIKKYYNNIFYIDFSDFKKFNSELFYITYIIKDFNLQEAE